MLTLLTLSLLAADPVVVVGPFTINGKATDPQSRALQSVLEFDLRANGLQVRTDDDLDSKNWGKVKGATHVAIGSAMMMGAAMRIDVRIVKTVDQELLGTGRARGLDDREELVHAVFVKTGAPSPPKFKLLKVDQALLTQWGAALEAIHSGEPADAKKKVQAVAEKWPDFGPAKERLEQLGATK